MKGKNIEFNEKLHKEFGVKIFNTVVVGAKGQVVIPLTVRKNLNIKPGDALMVVTKHNKAIGMIKIDDINNFMSYIKKEIKSCQ